MKKTMYLLIAATLVVLSCKKSEDSILPENLNEVTLKGGRVVEVFKSQQQFTQLISQNVEKTFGKPLPYELQRVDHMEINNKLVSTIIYKTLEGETSFVVLTDLNTLEKKVIDCTGSCDCRVRMIIRPDEEIYECTCNNCKMTVETVQ